MLRRNPLSFIKKLQRGILLVTAALLISSSLTTLAPIQAGAAELVDSSTKVATNYTWSDRQTISVTGGSVSANQGLKVDANAANPTSGGGRILVTEVWTVKDCVLWVFCSESEQPQECYVSITIAFSSGLSRGTLTSKITAGAGTGEGPTDCTQKTHDAYNGKVVSIGGTRPGDGSGTTENPEQKTVFFVVRSEYSESEAPDSISLRVTGTSTKNLTANKSELNGVVSFRVSDRFEPGPYTVTVVNPPEGLVVSATNFTKVKFSTLTVNVGEAEGFSNRQIKVEVEIKTQDPSAQTYGPLNLYLYDAAGEEVATTETDSVTMEAVTEGQLNERLVYLRGIFDNINPGTYRLCIGQGTTLCQDVTKEEGKQKSIKFEVSGEDIRAGAGDGATSCAIDGLGWIICPVVNFLAGIADGAFGVLADNFLRTDPQVFNTQGSAYQAWSVMRTIANVAFVIMFLIIIMSQLTSLGISNYGVKKMLPRLVIAAILVNLSFFISQLAVDISNILGYSIKDVFESITQLTIGGADAQAAINNQSPFATGEGFAGVAGVVLAGVVAGAALYAMLSTLIPVLLAAVVALIMIMFILVLRQALIILLVVISPLAFVAFLLPNTEPLFKKWRQTLTAMLLLFPIVALVFGASTLASQILSTTFNGGIEGDTDNWFGQIIAAAVMILPLFVVPTLLKKSLDGVGGIGSMLNNLSSRAGKGLGGAYKGSSFNKYREGLKADKRSRISAGNYAGRNPISKMRSRLNSKLNSGRAFNAATGGYGADRALGAQAQNRKDMQDAIAMFNNDDALVAAWAESGGDTKHASFAALQEPQKALFRKMRDAGHHRKSTSFLAAAQYMSENGKGSAATVQAALSHARSAGADSTVVSGAMESAIAAYRKSGRGDALAVLRTSTGTPMSAEQGWSEVAASTVHRDGIDPSNPAGRASYENFLQLAPENTRQALVGFDAMEPRAKQRAEAIIVAAAQLHEYNATGATPTITTVKDAKDYFGVK